MALRAVLFDLDGTLYQQGRAVPGAVDAVAAVRAAGLAVGFVTNTTSRPRRAIHQRCAGYGFRLAEPEITTALLAGARRLRSLGIARVHAVVTEAARADLAGFTLTDEHPEAVLVGDIDLAWNADILNRAFRHLMDGARFFALSRDRYWLADGGLRLDCGSFVAALEYATGVPAELCGKPAAEFYRAAVEQVAPGAPPGEVLMVGDDLWSDIAGARDAGLRTCLVRTGKFRRDVLETSGIVPDLLVDSAAAIPAALPRA